MTRGGLALAVGILVGRCHCGSREHQSKSRGRTGEGPGRSHPGQRLANSDTRVRRDTSICIVFAPMFLLSGVARYLFVPLAEQWCSPCWRSYLLSRTIVPTWPSTYCAEKKGEGKDAAVSNPLVRLHKRVEEAFERLRGHYRGMLEFVSITGGFSLLCSSRAALARSQF